jgi:hypothetical protein
MVNINKCIKCIDFPCLDANKDCFLFPSIEIDNTKIKLLMVSETPSLDSKDYFDAKGTHFYMQTTAQAF